MSHTLHLAALDEPLQVPEQFYDGPIRGADNCSCNTVVYSIVAVAILNYLLTSVLLKVLG